MDDTQRLKKIISEELGIALRDLTDKADLRVDLNAEELEIADCIAKIEQVFSHRLSEEEIKRVRTVSNILDLFQE